MAECGCQRKRSHSLTAIYSKLSVLSGIFFVCFLVEALPLSACDSSSGPSDVSRIADRLCFAGSSARSLRTAVKEANRDKTLQLSRRRMRMGVGGGARDSRRCVLLRGCSVGMAGALASMGGCQGGAVSACAAAASETEEASSPAAPEAPAKEDDLQLVYVGAGCFWHVQHEMVLAERELLGRSRDSFTSVAGYAGGTRVGKDETVCYHNRSPHANLYPARRTGVNNTKVKSMG